MVDSKSVKSSKYAKYGLAALIGTLSILLILTIIARFTSYNIPYLTNILNGTTTNTTNTTTTPEAQVMDLRNATTYQDDISLYDKQAPVNDMSFVNSTTGRPWSECNHYANEWWGVDLGSVVDVSYIILQGRADCCEKRLQGVDIYLGSIAGSYNGNPVVKTNVNVQSNKSLQVNINASGQYLYIRRPHESTPTSALNGLTVCKLYVFAK